MLDSHANFRAMGLWILAATILLLGLLKALPAEGAPKPDYYARLTANFHLQVQISALTTPEFMPGACVVKGTVVRLFRARTDTSDMGDTIEVPVLCTVAKEEELTGDIAAVEELANARFIEMYVNPLPEAGFELARQQFMVIVRPSDDPQCETERAGIMC